MECNYVSSTTLLTLIFSTAFLLVLSDAAANYKPQVPAIYVFGDSTADVGNNNYLNGITAKADYPHYGIDFPGSSPTGRFSNGYNGVDFIASHMGFRRSPPPYLSLKTKTNHQIFRGQIGVNFASAGSGILNSTGDTITMAKQMELFATFKSDLVAKTGEKEANNLLSKSIFLISSGGNDLFAFFSSNPAANETSAFLTNIISNYAQHLQTLHKLGARKFAVIDVPPVGCCPLARSLSPTGDCITPLNTISLTFNSAVATLLQNLAIQLKDMKYSIASSYTVVSNIVANPLALGFKEVKTACCGNGRFNAATLCKPNATYCGHRSKYLFWDRLHPSHATSKIAAAAFYTGSLQFATPINFKQLVQE